MIDLTKDEMVLILAFRWCFPDSRKEIIEMCGEFVKLYGKPKPFSYGDHGIEEATLTIKYYFPELFN